MVNRVVDGCHTCAALKNIPSRFHEQSTSAPSKIGSRFSADVLRESGQCILVLRESISSFTDATIIHDEKAVTLGDGIVTLTSRLRSPLGHHAIIRTDPASGLRSLLNDDRLKSHNMSVELGDEKNINKNPIAEKAIEELRAELVRLQPLGGKITPLMLSHAVSNMNSRIRHNKLSAYEIWTRREMSTGEALKLDDSELIKEKVSQRVQHHTPSSKYKARGNTNVKIATCKKGDIVYLFSDREKSKSRDKYLVVEVDENYAHVQKFTGNQFRARRYRVKLTDIITVSQGQITPKEAASEVSPSLTPSRSQRPNCDSKPCNTYEGPGANSESSDDSEDEWTCFSDFLPKDPPVVPQTVGRPKRATRLPGHLAQDYILDNGSDSSSDEQDITHGLFDTTNESDAEGSTRESINSDEENPVTVSRPKRNAGPPDRYQS